VIAWPLELDVAQPPDSDERHDQRRATEERMSASERTRVRGR
jgi:hypothetical protein